MSAATTSMGAPILEVEELNAWYGAAHILFDLSFHVGRGEVVALMGRNGAGKSTTIKAMMGLIARRTGTVRFYGEDISRLRPFEIARRGMGFVPEDRRIFPTSLCWKTSTLAGNPHENFPTASQHRLGRTRNCFLFSLISRPCRTAVACI